MMKRFLFLSLVVAGMFYFAVLAVTSAAHDHSQEKNAFTPDTMPWGPAPPVVRHGAQFAVLEGDPTASTGDFTIRLKMPDGFRIAPHWHPNRENVTIISGKFKVGMGDEFRPRHAPLRHGLRRNHRAGPRAISTSVQLRQSCRRSKQESVVGTADRRNDGFSYGVRCDR
jgi:hypothetical protein